MTDLKYEMRDMTRRGFTKAGTGRTGSSQQLFNDPMLSISGVDAEFVEHVKVGKEWFVKVPEREQKRLENEWAVRA